MKKLRGTHTTLTPLSEEIYNILNKQKIRISPGLIIRKDIKVKQVSIKLKEENGTVLTEVLMKSSKQFLRIYDSSIPEIKNLLTPYCKLKNILLK